MEMEMVMLNGKFNLKWIWNSLYEFEMNELKAKINEEIKISKKKENWARKNINNLENRFWIKIYTKRYTSNKNNQVSISTWNKRYLY